MSMILEKYKNKRKLGKGAYGDVLLVQDPNGKQMAIKMVSKKIIQKDPYLQQYLEGQKEVMMSVKNRHVVQLYAFEQDENFKYFVCEYCDGGDLLNYQAKQPNKVFALKQATEILSQVIRGLQMLHYKGYLHRDIKPANILLKKTNQADKFEFKLADFGFAKKNSEIGGTVLGTEHYMSPQIFSNQIYSYEVDMWAFGVLFYFMLNMELPFRINPHASIESKQQDLIKQATNFSYKETVQKSKKRLLNNCSQDVQDLFLRIFNPDGQKRITFLQIREHQLFKQFFPVIQSQSRILYKSKQINRYDSFVLQKQSNIQHKGQFNKNKSNKPATNNVPQNNQQNEQNTTNAIQDNAIPSLHIAKANTSQQKSLLQAEYDKITFLEQVSKEFRICLDFIDSSQVTALSYNLLKFHIILLRNFYGSLKAETLQKDHPGLKWRQHSKNPQFTTFKNKIRQKIDEVQLLFSTYYDQCREIAASIRSTNPQLQASLENQVTNKDFSGAFKQSYRSSTGFVYGILRQKLSNGNKFAYLTALIVMCHAFNNLIECGDEQLEELFPDFVKDRTNKDHIQFIELKNWMSTSNKQKIKVVIKNILSTFFSG